MPISVSATATIKAIACKTDYSNSSVVSFAYTITNGTVATPVISMQDSLTSKVQITTTTPGATIYYTLDGNNPTTSSSQYSAPFFYPNGLTVKAFAVKTNYADSAVSTYVDDGKVYDNGSLANTFMSDKTALLMHMSGTNNSTSFVDSSDNQFTVTANGSAKISTSISKVGGSSAYFDGDGGSYVRVESSSKLAVASNNFTIEAWAYPTQKNSGSDLAGVIDTRNYGGGTGILIWLDSTSGKWVAYTSANGNSNQDVIESSSQAQLNAWTHLAFSRSGNTLRFFVNGVLQGSLTRTYNFSDASTQVLVGTAADGPGSWRNFYGYIDEVRVSINQATYTAAYTPPTAEFNIFTGCYANGVITADVILKKTGWCSSASKYYVNGIETSLPSNGTGYDSGKSYIAGVRQIYVRSSGNTTNEGSVSLPVSTAQKAFEKAYAYSGDVAIDLGAGSFGGVDLDAAGASYWPSRIKVLGVSAASSNLGGITGYSCPSIIISGDNSANLGDINVDCSYDVGSKVTLSNLTAGVIHADGYLGGGTVTLQQSISGAISVNGSDLWDGNLSSGGTVTLSNGSVAGDISASGVANWVAGNGGVVNISSSSAGNISAVGADYDAGGNGGQVTLINGTVTGNISVNGGAGTSGSGGSGGVLLFTSSTVSGTTSYAGGAGTPTGSNGSKTVN